MPVASDAAIERAASEGASLSKLKPGPGHSPAEVADHQRARIQRATIEIVAQHGYGALTVREITRQAGVSTKAHYELYASKELAFQDSHEAIVRRLLRGLVERQAATGPDGVGQIFASLLDEVAQDPQAARFALIDACEAGPDALARMHLVDRSLGAAIAECLGRTSGGSPASSRLIGAMVAGAMAVVRSRLLDGAGEELPALADPLARWALSYVDPVAADLDELNRAMTPPGPREGFLPPVPSGAGEPSGDLPLLLSATGRLVAGEGYEDLSVRKVLLAAGIPRRGFYANFSRIEDCFVAALELQMNKGLACVRETGETEHDTCKAVAALSERVAGDGVFANLCFGEFAAPAKRVAECRQRFTVELGQALLGELAPATEALALEASMGALWGTIHNEVTMGRARQVPRLNATLAYLALAPAIGPSPAVEQLLIVDREPRLKTNH